MMSEASGECTAPIKIDTWNFGIDFNDLVSKAVSAVIANSFDEQPPTLFFAKAYGGESPYSVSVSLPLGPFEDEDAVYQFDLRDCLKAFAAARRCSDGTLEDAEDLASISFAFREMADWIDAQLTAKTPVTPPASQKPVR
jgi:hypothetical protein